MTLRISTPQNSVSSSDQREFSKDAENGGWSPMQSIDTRMSVFSWNYVSSTVYHICVCAKTLD